MTRKITLILLSLLIVTLAACSIGNNGETGMTPTDTPNATPKPTPTPTTPPPKPQVAYNPVPADALSPAVIQRMPRRGETLAPDGGITLVFDREMNPDSVAQALTVQQAGNPPTPIAGSLAWEGKRMVTFRPQSPLPRDTVFDVILTQDATAATGEPLREPYTFRFQTAGYLEVGQVIPAPGTTDVEPKTTITVMFNRPVVPLTSLGQMADLPNPLSFEPAISGTGEWLNTSVFVFTPDAPLTGGVTYTAEVSADLKAIGGEMPQEAYRWQFTVAPPKILSVQPNDGSTLIDINTAVRITFNQPVDLNSAKEHFSLTGKSGLLKSGTVNGKFALDGNTLVFTPTKSLAFDTTYTAEMAAGVVAASGGNGMREPLKWQFTTVPLPKIVSTTPKNGERHAPPRTGFDITFNTRIDPETVMPNVTFTPEISASQVYTYFSEYNNTFHIDFGAQPSSDYTVVIRNGIADPYGNTIPKGRTVKFHTDDLPPNYQLVTPDFIATYDADQPAQTVIGSINVHRVNLKLYQLGTDVLRQPYWQFYDMKPKKSQLMRDWQVNLETPKNKQRFTPIDLLENGGKLQPGVYLLETSSPDLPKDYTPQRHVLVVSKLNLTIKTELNGVTVWATDLTTGAPVPNLTLDMLDMSSDPPTKLAAITTDADGVAQMQPPANRSYYGDIIAISTDPFVAGSANWSRGISPYDFGVGGGDTNQTFRVHLYTDRPIYRPGHSVQFKGIIRTENDAHYRLPDIGQVHVTIRDAQYQTIFDDNLPVDAMGTFNGSVQLEDGASLGTYAIGAEFADGYAETTFQVAAYRPPEFEMTVEPGAPEIQRGDPLTATIAAKYFFGGGLADTPVQWNVLEERYSFSVPWGDRYSFDDADDPYVCFRCWWWTPPAPPEPILSGSDTTDTNGEVSLTLDGAKLSDALKQHASKLTIEATASGPDNQEIAGRSTVIVHPGAWYIGLAPQRYVSYAEKPTNIDLVTVDWDGNRLSGKSLNVTLVHREWENVFVKTESGGGYWDWKTKDTPVTTVTVTTDDRGEAVATFTPPTGGSYHIIATPAEPTAAETHIRSSIFIWVTGKGNVSWRRDNNDRITLISDKTSYQVGDTAEVLIPSPFDGEQYALITVERANILRHEVLKLENNSTIYRLPITDDDIPNIYLSVVLVKGRTAENPADYKMGVLPLDVSTAPRTLVLHVKPDTELTEPGETVNFTVTATEPDGTPAAGAELSLDMVDKAVLSLRPRSGDILTTFYGRRSLQVSTASGLSISGNRYFKQLSQDLDLEVEPEQPRGLGDVFGGAADMAMEAAPAPEVMKAAVPTEAPAAEAANIAPPEGVDIRENFADTALWQPTVTTDSNGKATVSVTLPDNLTTWVLRGVGVTRDTHVGETTTDVVATKPLLVRPVTPRFFVVDDRAELAANISNNTDTDLETEVSLAAQGIAINADTPPRQTVTIPAHSETKVTWDVRVNDVVSTTLVFSAVSGEYSDASKPRLTTAPDGSLMVLRYTAPDIVGTAGQLPDGGSVTEGIALPPNFDDRRGQLTIQLDPSLAAGMRDGLKYLEHYEYECTEQTVSRFLPNVLTWHALKSLGIDNPELAENLPGLLEKGLDKLYREQNPDGGWGWWYRTDRWQSNEYITAYVVFALLKARQADVSVSDTVLANGINYLKQQVQAVDTFNAPRIANRQAWLLYVLSEADAVSPARLDELFNQRDNLSTYARAYLAQAIWLQNKNDDRLPTLLSDINNAAILSATGAHWEENFYDWWAMNTDTRTTAIVLDTLTKLDPDNALNPNVVRWLMVARRGGIWETTQETAWALISLTDWMLYTGELDANFDYSVYLNDAQLGGGTVTPDTVQNSTKITVPITNLLADALNTLAIARTDGNGRLYYTAHLEVYQPVENIQPAERGIIVQRKYSLASCTDAVCPDVREAKLGDVIRVDLTIIAPHDLYYVVVEDPLPAGGEAIDTGLATTSLLAMGPSLQRQNSPYWWWWHWYSRSELRDEKVVLFADYLSKGTYEYSYTFRATLPGDYHVIPTVAKEFYFPEVFGRSDGRLLSIGR